MAQPVSRGSLTSSRPQKQGAMVHGPPAVRSSPARIVGRTVTGDDRVDVCVGRATRRRSVVIGRLGRIDHRDRFERTATSGPDPRETDGFDQLRGLSHSSSTPSSVASAAKSRRRVENRTRPALVFFNHPISSTHHPEPVPRCHHNPSATEAKPMPGEIAEIHLASGPIPCESPGPPVREEERIRRRADGVRCNRRSATAVGSVGHRWPSPSRMSIQSRPPLVEYSSRPPSRRLCRR